MLWRQMVVMFLVLFNSTCECQEETDNLNHDGKYKVIETIPLPAVINETSGLENLDSLILSFNDSGGDPVIYGINPKTGELETSWFVKNAKNVDWEDITSDDEHIYIGDFGNNVGSRQDQTIYIIPITDLVLSDTVSSGAIKFSFEDQNSFTPSIYNHSFDCEAIISKGDSLIMFSKDWKNKISTVYILPKNPGMHLAKKKFVFQSQGLITGADYLEEQEMLVLCGYENFNPFIWKVENVDFLSGSFSKAIKYDMLDYSGIQNEGICFLTPETLLMSTEAKYIKQKMYVIELY